MSDSWRFSTVPLFLRAVTKDCRNTDVSKCVCWAVNTRLTPDLERFKET